MKKIDAYIVKKYLATFFFVALIFTMISIVIDLSEKVEDFIEEPVTKMQIIQEYYINYIPYINSLLWPLFAMISVIFFTSRMAYNSELISILNAGVSFIRMMLPYMIAGCFIAGLHFIGNHYLVPIGNKHRLDFEHTYIWKHNDKGKTNEVHMFLNPESKVYIKYYRKKDTIARDIRLESLKDNELVSVIKAKRAEWQGYPDKWRFFDYEIRSFKGLNESIVLGSGKQIDTIMNLRPEDFVRYQNQKEMMTTPDLYDFIANEKSRGLSATKEFEVEIHRRTAEPFTIIILTIIGMAIASRKVRGGMGLHLALGVALGALFIFLSKFSITFATNESLPPVLGVWIPNIMFSFVAVFLVLRAQK